MPVDERTKVYDELRKKLVNAIRNKDEELACNYLSEIRKLDKSMLPVTASGIENEGLGISLSMPLEYAVKQKMYHLVDQLLDVDALLAGELSHGRVLCIAAKNGDVEYLKKLKEKTEMFKFEAQKGEVHRVCFEAQINDSLRTSIAFNQSEFVEEMLSVKAIRNIVKRDTLSFVDINNSLHDDASSAKINTLVEEILREKNTESAFDKLENSRPDAITAAHKQSLKRKKSSKERIAEAIQSFSRRFKR